MKVVINTCFGGFSLSPLAIQEIAKRKGKDCYFFKHDYNSNTYSPLTLEEAMEERWSVFAYTVPNPNDYRLNEKDEDGLYRSANKRSEEISLDSRPENRSDPDLVAVVEALGKRANGSCADLAVVEIPDGVDYEIDEYDGNEHIAERHRTWR